MIAKSLGTLLLAASLLVGALKGEKYRQFFDSNAGRIHWKAGHWAGWISGSIPLEFGYLDFEDEQLQSGEIIIGFRGIKIFGLESADQARVDSLIHSSSLFKSYEFPNARFSFNAVKKGYHNQLLLKGMLEIRGQIRPKEIPAHLKEVDGVWVLAGSCSFNRTAFGMNYASPSDSLHQGSFFIQDLVYLDFELPLKARKQILPE